MIQRVALVASMLAVWFATSDGVRAAINGSIESAKPLNNSMTSDTGGDNGVEIATDGSGNWVAVWTSSDSLGGSIGTDLRRLVCRRRHLFWRICRRFHRPIRLPL